MITEKDLQALLLIYNTGTIAKNHLQRLVWKTDTAKNRLAKLFKEGYLLREPYVMDRGKNKKGRKQTSMYYLTNKAIRYIAPYIDEKETRNSFANTPGKKKKDKPKYRREYYQMTELRCQLYEQDIITDPSQWYSSKQAKSKFKLRNNLPFHAILQNANDGYDVYFFIDERAGALRPHKIKTAIKDIHYNNAGISETQKSLLRSTNANRYFILASDSCVKSIIEKFIEDLTEQQQIYCLEVGSKQRHRKDYSPIITLYTNPNYYYQEIKERLYSEYGHINLIPSFFYEPSTYKFIYNGQVIHVVELITGSINKLEKLLLKATTTITPDLLYLYIPTQEYYDTIINLLPENHFSWLRLIIRSDKNGK